jgi:hypothetical protein
MHVGIKRKLERVRILSTNESSAYKSIQTRNTSFMRHNHNWGIALPRNSYAFAFLHHRDHHPFILSGRHNGKALRCEPLISDHSLMAACQRFEKTHLNAPAWDSYIIAQLSDSFEPRWPSPCRFFLNALCCLSDKPEFQPCSYPCLKYASHDGVYVSCDMDWCVPLRRKKCLKYHWVIENLR